MISYVRRVKMKIGRRIARWRTLRGLTQRQFADVLGLSQPAVNHWEAGNANPTVEHLEKIAKALGVSMQDFFGEVPRGAGDVA